MVRHRLLTGASAVAVAAASMLLAITRHQPVLSEGEGSRGRESPSSPDSRSH